MGMVFEIIKISPRIDENIDYNSLIIKVFITKKLSMDNARDLWIFFVTMINGGVKKILIDMDGLEFIDSSGIGILINAAKMLRTKNGDIVFTNVSSEIKKIFKVVNLQNFIKIYNLEGEAINYFRFD